MRLRLKKITLSILLIFIIGFSWLLSSCSDSGSAAEADSQDSQIQEHNLIDDYDSTVESAVDSVYLYGEIIPNRGIIEAMTTIGVDFTDARLITNVMSYHVDFRYIRAGEKIGAVFSKDTTKIFRFDYTPSPVVTHTVYDSAGTLVYTQKRKPTQFKTRLVRGQLENTLDASLRIHDIGNAQVQTVNNALMSKISFRYDARNGDEFTVFLEEEFYENERIGGNVLYASYNGKRAGFHEAYRYFDGDNQSSFNGLYTPKGESLISTQMRYPLDRMHVTSPFGMRIHPVLGTRRFHNGVDLAARTGTPVYSVQRGVVHSTGSDGVNGNFVVLRHNNGYMSYYLHLSRILVRRGQNIGSRQIVGRAGSTGRSTGPHLHLGIKNNQGKWINPMRMRMIAATKLENERLESYKIQVEEIRNFKMLNETISITQTRAFPVI